MTELTATEKYRHGIAEARTEAERLRTLATDESVTSWIRVVIRDLDDADRWIAETRESFRFAMADISITIDKENQRMTVFDGKAVHMWRVSTGAPGYGTPTGSYQGLRMAREHYSKEWDDAPMPNSIFFTDRGHAIHGTSHTARLGTPASHGCVRLPAAFASKLFAATTVGTEVMIGARALPGQASG